MKDLQKLIIVMLLPCLVLLNFPFSTTVKAKTEEEGPSLKIIHSQPKSVKAGAFIPISAKLEDREGIELVRVYFREANTKPYYFVPMIVAKGNEYYALLPAPESENLKIEYLFLVKTYNSRIFNSQTFNIVVSGIKKSQPDTLQDKIDVLVETKTIPAKLEGFNEDTAKVRLVTSHEKHGAIAGLYDLEATGGSASSGQYHGTIISSKESNSNLLLIGGGVVAGAVALAVVAGSSGSDGGSSSSPPTGVTSTGNGLWTLEFDYSPCLKTTSQSVECSEEGLVTAVSPTAIGLPLPDDCANTPFAGLSEIFIVGGSCDTVTVCNNYSPAGLTSKTCEDTTMIFQKENGSRVERWSAQ